MSPTTPVSSTDSRPQDSTEEANQDRPRGSEALPATPDPDDPQDAIEAVRRWLGVESKRRFSYQGTARDRNVHVMSGRTE